MPTLALSSRRTHFCAPIEVLESRTLLVAPNIQVKVEPLEAGAVVYETISPRASNFSSQGLLALLVSIKDLGAASVHVNKTVVSFPGSSVASKTYTHDLTISSSQTKTWNTRNDNGVDNRIKLPASAPTQVRLSVYADNFSDPRVITLPLKAHTMSPVAGGSYNFPASASDLRIGEYWSGSSNHATGSLGSQLFGYDLGVIAWDSANSRWSGLLPGTNNSNNSDSRIFGKPVRAMAAGKVVQVDWNVPNNPKPLSWTTTADLNSKLALQKALYWGSFTYGGGGNHIYVQHGDEIVLYAHMQRNSIPASLRVVGANIVAGQQLGLAGNSGNSTGPHLHIHSVQGTTPETGPLRPLPFRNAYMIDRTLLSPPNPAGNWVKAEDVALAFADTVIWPATTAPAWYPPNWSEVALHGISAANFQTEFNKVDSSHYRPVFIDGFNAANGGVYYNSIWRKSDGVVWQARFGLTAAQYQTEFNLRAGQGYRLLNLDSYVSAGSVRYAAIWVKQSGPAQTAYHGLTQAQHQAQVNSLSAQGWVPVNVSATSVSGVKRYAAFYEKKNIGSWVLRSSQTPAQYQAEYTANANAGRKLAYLNSYNHGGLAQIVAIWYSTAVSPLNARHGLTSSQYQTTYTSESGAGHLLRAVTGYVDGGITRYAAFWTA